MKRREFITLLGGATLAWPLAARAQQPGLPVIGFLFVGLPPASVLSAFRKGLSEAGFVEGRDVTIEHRWTEEQVAQLPALATELARRKVAVIYAAGGATAVVAAKAATMTVPIIFTVGDDPVEAGLVDSLNRPGGNVTGFSFINAQLTAKRIGLLHELLPMAERFAMLINPADQRAAARVTVDAQAAVASIGRQIEVFTAATNREIDLAFASLVQKQADALIIGPSSLFLARRAQLSTLTARHALPTIHFSSAFVEAGGLMSYGSSIADATRQTAIYGGRILKGEKPADLPVQQATKFELAINLQTARVLDLTIPSILLARADEVIE
jgi:putative ABC transport system substrate-binding protein